MRSELIDVGIDTALGYWLSDDASEGGSSTSNDPGPLNCDDAGDQMPGADDVEGWGSLAGSSGMGLDFMKLLRLAHNLKLMKCLFLEFFIDYFYIKFGRG